MGNTELDKFPDGVLEYISKIIADYRTGSEITRLFEVAGYDIKHDNSTKWRFVYSIFKQFNDEPNGQYHIAKVIQTFCKPTEWIGNEETRRKVMDKLNEALIHMNIQFRDDGKLIVSNKRIKTIPEDQEYKVYEVDKRNESLTVFPIFKTRNVQQEDNLCFVLTPFESQFDRIYKEIIKPTVEELGFRCIRADDIFLPRPIPEDIWSYILKSQVIIADVTNKNPNVFYEMGIAHTVGKPVIIITQSEKDVPFDIHYIRYFLYSDNKEGWDKLRNNLRMILRNIKHA